VKDFKKTSSFNREKLGALERNNIIIEKTEMYGEKKVMFSRNNIFVRKMPLS